jgi:hypothetical protein
MATKVIDWCGEVWYTAVGRHECAVREGQLSSGHSPEFDFGAFPLQNLERIP